MNIDHDDELLAALSRLSADELGATPSAGERAALRALVDDKRGGAVVLPLVKRSARFGRQVAITGVVALVGLSGATAVAAAANNGALPNPIRRVVVAVGIPVDSVAVANVKDALRQLRVAGDPELAAAIARVESTRTMLSDDEHAVLDPEIERDLADARSRLAAFTAASTVTTIADTVPPTSPAPPSTTAPMNTVPETNDDHGGSIETKAPGSGTPGGATSDGNGDHGGETPSGPTTTKASGSGHGSGGSGDGSTGSGSGSGGGGGSSGGSGDSGTGGHDGSGDGSGGSGSDGGGNPGGEATQPPETESHRSTSSTTTTRPRTTTTTTAPSSSTTRPRSSTTTSPPDSGSGGSGSGGGGGSD